MIEPLEYIAVLLMSMIGVAVIIAWIIELSGRDFEESQKAEAEKLRQQFIAKITGKNVLYDKDGNIVKVKE